MPKSQLFIISFFVIIFVSCSKKEDSSLGGNYLGNIEVNSPGDQYNDYGENPFVSVSEQPVSTFSIDADGASYANVRRFILDDNSAPLPGAVRTEELINYFDLDYDNSNSSHPITLNGEISHCPWDDSTKLIRIGIKGKHIPKHELPASNFVFLIDVSGSMSAPDKLELLKRGFIQFVDEMADHDRVAIVTYAGKAGLLLRSTKGNEKQKIKDAINSLGSGGGTAGAEGIVTAYEIAEENFVPDGNNRVILGTDGAFNVGISSQQDLVNLIEEKRESGIFLTVLGVGRGNLNDAAMEQIANNGNGTYEYIDNTKQLKKVFVHDYNKFFTVAKDVKVQVKFNPENVESYRLIGYENRLLNEEDFEDDSKDAGEIGADQNITALYEIVPILHAQYKTTPSFTIDFRYKEPGSDNSVPMELEIYDKGNNFSESTDLMKFTASIAAFSMLITNSAYKGTSDFDQVISWLNEAQLPDKHGFKQEFKEIVRNANDLY